ncbi:MAG TPA: hypothetical protein VFV79_02095 [Saprospiraceae bacterium]|nr:hypothetical protein [Saprospiraceae bacterium]
MNTHMKSTRKKIAYTRFSILSFWMILLLLSCNKDEAIPIDCSGLTPTYTADIKNIIDSHCAITGCHNTFSHQEGIDLSNYQGASAASHNDNFLGAIQHKKGYQPMPKDAAKLSDSKIQLLTCWVQNGSPE